MPEYLAPGVYVEETSFRSKSIEGVSTTTTGFVGPTRYGPVELEPDIVTSLGEFERMYGDRQQLQFTDPQSGGADPLMHNYVWHAVRAFFEEGGKRLYIARVFSPIKGNYPPDDFDNAKPNQQGLYEDGHARGNVPQGGGDNSMQIRARFPGAAGREMRVVFTVRLGQNVLGREPVLDAQGRVIPGQFRAKVSSLLDRDVVRISIPSSPRGPGA